MSDNEKQSIRASEAKINAKLAAIETTMESIKKFMMSIKLDRANYLLNTVNIQPSTGVKITYNKYGQITASESLSEEDIPDISITKIKGLQDRLNEYASLDEVKNVLDIINKKTSKGNIYGTGSKVSIDENGRVVGLGSLTAEDIPQIPIEKIKGLNDKLKSIINESRINAAQVYKEDPFKITPSTGVKISYDSKGRVTGSSNLEEADLPYSLISKVDELLNDVKEMVPMDTFNQLKEEISYKLISPVAVPGVYTKVQIDENGRVVYGSDLSISDLPELTISDIIGLKEELEGYVKESTIGTIVEIISPQLNKIDNLESENAELKQRVTKLESEISALRMFMGTITTQYNEIVKGSLGNEVVDEINRLRSTNSALSGRIAVLEQRLGLHDTSNNSDNESSIEES